MKLDPFVRAAFGTILSLGVVLLGVVSSHADEAAATTPAQAADTPKFEQDVRPILKAHCFHCHGEAGKKEGKLDLRLRRLLVQGGESGPAIAPGKPEASRLLERVKAGEMPPKAPLAAAEIRTLERWIAAGAPTVGAEPDDVAALGGITALERSYWAFQPVRRPNVSAGTERHRSPIDVLIAASLAKQQLDFNPDADRVRLVRRAYLDLLGLPPTPEDVAAFAADDAPDAYERLLDRLLASPHYGERWGRHWLDVAGYADSDGYTETDPLRPYAYKYRDYVIRALNADKPFDQFVLEQLAGDELAGPIQGVPNDAQIEKLVATGFLRTVPDGTASGVAPKEAANAVMAETIKVVTSSLLGLTVGCAQCHDHRYDPIRHEDYYRFRAIFEPALDWKAWRNTQQRRISLYTDADRAKAAAIEAEAVKLEAERTKKQNDYIEQTFQKELAKIAEEKREPIKVARAKPVAQRSADEQKLLMEFPSVNVDAGSLYLYDPKAAEDLKKEAEKIAAHRATKPVEDFVSCLNEVPGHLPVTNLYDRGDPDQPKQAVEPAELVVLSAPNAPPLPAKDAALATSGRRLAYARQLVDGRHPLTARVFVNRLWLHHFGRGLVATPGDFGVLGDRPTHPELLDWLAAELVAREWSPKSLHRQMMSSTTYRQSAHRPEAKDLADPDNRWLGRATVRRLEAETVRDAILAIGDSLNRRAFGPAVPVMEDDVGQIVIGIENKNGENRPGPIIPMHGEDFRRSVYVQVRRTRPLGVLDSFDLPTLEPNCVARSNSTVAPQALLLMNSDFILDGSRLLAERLRREAPGDAAAQVRTAWQLVFGRLPDEAEARGAAEFLANQEKAFGEKAAKEPDPKKKLDPPLWSLSSLCQALFSSNEFLYVD